MLNSVVNSSVLRQSPASTRSGNPPGAIDVLYPAGIPGMRRAWMQSLRNDDNDSCRAAMVDSIRSQQPVPVPRLSGGRNSLPESASATAAIRRAHHHHGARHQHGNRDGERVGFDIYHRGANCNCCSGSDGHTACDPASKLCKGNAAGDGHWIYAR